jgi:hypothetical protein
MGLKTRMQSFILSNKSSNEAEASIEVDAKITQNESIAVEKPLTVVKNTYTA